MAQIDSDIRKNKQDLELISPMVQDSIKVLNAAYSDGLRKRKGDVCRALGKSFGGFTKSDSSSTALFDEKSIKLMKPYIKTVNNSLKHK